MELTIAIAAAVCFAVGAGLSYVFFRYGLKTKYDNILKEAETEAEVIKKNKLLEVKEKFLNKKADLEKEVALRNQKIQQVENKLKQREMVLNQRNEEVQRKKAEADAVEPFDQALQAGQQQASFHSQAKHTQEEVQILKQRQYGDIKRNGYNYSAHISGIDPQGQKIVQIAKTYQQAQIKRLSHGVKQQADYQKYQILTFQIRHQKIGQQCRRKQNIQKKQIGKLHPAAPPNSKSYS